MDEEEVLRKAARAGIRLLEDNKALNDEVLALREQVVVLECERPKLRAHLETQTIEMASVVENRKNLLIETSALHSKLEAKSALVKNMLEKENQLKIRLAEAEAAKMLVENQVFELQTELEQLKMHVAKAEALERNYTISNPATAYDLNEACGITYMDYEKLQHRLQITIDENEAQTLETKRLRKEVDALRLVADELPGCLAHIEWLESRKKELQSANDTLHAERLEEQAVLESLRAMNSVYKRTAESLSSMADCSCSQLLNEESSQALGVTMHDVLIETNLKLEAKLRGLRAGIKATHLSENDTNKVLGPALKRASSISSSGSASSDTPSSSSSSETSETVIERLNCNLLAMTEKFKLSKEMLHHAKVQWCAAIASQKALEECNRLAQVEVSRLTQLLDCNVAACDGTDAKDKQRRVRLESEKSSKWTEETAPFAAPPGDINSPMIKCLLDHWTTDKSKCMVLTDWLHNSIRGTGRATPMRLTNLSSEVTAGFLQLLVPIMRERHNVSVSIYRRDNLHVLTDLVLQTNHSHLSASTFEPQVVKTREDPGKSAEPQLDSVLCRSRDTCGGSILLKGEAKFLYG
ncbi:hypothetical protein CCR75_005390 [Bremia lactucae]|uniref:Uncharacterized protein n=1 Tax=Bremia lactucae TaxID=4779 RepID=A0A976FLF5_BRELC|nr:hypothetical protein CCR75_005390 [Bremia lactucae]